MKKLTITNTLRKFDLSEFSGSFPEIILRLIVVADEFEEKGYTNLQIDCDVTDDGEDLLVLKGDRQETDKELEKRKVAWDKRRVQRKKEVEATKKMEAETYTRLKAKYEKE